MEGVAMSKYMNWVLTLTVIALVLSENIDTKRNIPYLCPHTLRQCDCTMNVENSETQTFTCPPQRTNTNLQYTVYYTIDQQKVMLECMAQSINYIPQMFSQFEFQNVTNVNFYRCPIPQNLTFADILDGIDEEIESLRINLVSVRNPSDLDAHAFGSLPRVRKLSVEAGMFLELGEDTFEGMPGLRELTFTSNAISELKKEMLNKIPQLQSLDLSHNMLENINDGAFEFVPLLQNLSLSHNHITRLTKSIFFGLHSLQHLNLRNNQLEFLADGIFSELSSLKSLDLSYNNLPTLTVMLFSNTPKLEILRIRDNRNLTQIPANIFKNVTNLRELDLGRNRLSSITAKLLKPLVNLERAIFDGNQIQNISAEETFSSNLQLVEINLAKNKLSHLPQEIFKDLSHLTIVNLSENFLDSISKGIFTGLPSLDRIDLNNNDIAIVDGEAFNGLNNVTYIDLSHNIIDFDHQDDELMLPPNLQFLNMSSNHIGNISESWPHAPALVELNLTYNHIYKVSASQLVFQSRQVIVDLSHNSIHTVNLSGLDERFLAVTPGPGYGYNDPMRPSLGVTGGRGLPKIVMEYNPIICDCNLLEFLRFLKRGEQPDAPFRIIVGQQQCNGPLDQDMVVGVSLTAVLEENLACRVHEGCNPRCICRKYSVSGRMEVDCRTRNMTSMPHVAPHNATVLHLDDNIIRVISGLGDPMWANLTRIYFNHNKLFSLGDPVSLPRSLQLLQLHDNLLKRAPDWLLMEISKLPNLSVSLGDNPWICDCKSVRFYQWFSAMGDRILDKSRIKCSKNGQPVGEEFSSITIRSICPKSSSSGGSVAGPIVAVLLMITIIAVIAGMVLHNRERVKLWLFRRHLCLWLRSPDDIESGHPL